MWNLLINQHYHCLSNINLIVTPMKDPINPAQEYYNTSPIRTNTHSEYPIKLIVNCHQQKAYRSFIRIIAEDMHIYFSPIRVGY